MDDDMPPELEDFSEELNKIRSTRGGSNHAESSSEIKVNVIENTEPKKIQSEKSKSSQSKSEEDNFGSFMKKGFFKRNNANQTKTTNDSNKNNKLEDLTHIKSNPGNTQEKKVFKEIENELKMNSKIIDNDNKSKLLNNIVEKKEEWLNQELLMKIAQKPNLMKAFMDPRFSEVITLLQKDPQKAIAQFGHVKEFNEFIKEFSSIMADHFGNLSKDTDKQSSQNLNNLDQETQSILNDPKIIPIITKLQNEGKLDIEEVNKDPYLSSRINKLIDKGVFKVQRESELSQSKK
jgi:hypothetical protein